MSFSDHASWHRMLIGPADLAIVGKPSAAAAVPTARKRRRDDRDVLRIGGSLSVVHLPRTPRGYSRADNPGNEGKPAEATGLLVDGDSSILLPGRESLCNNSPGGTTMDDSKSLAQRVEPAQPSRRRLLKTAAAAGGAAIVSAPYIGNAAAAETTVWKVQTSWPAGGGLQTFKTWAGTVKEKTGGELEIKPFAAKEVVGDFELIDGVKNGVLEAMNSFTLYWAGKLPSTAFLSSYLMGLRYPHEWDIFFYSKDGLKVTREHSATQGLYYD